MITKTTLASIFVGFKAYRRVRFKGFEVWGGVKAGLLLADRRPLQHLKHKRGGFIITPRGLVLPHLHDNLVQPPSLSTITTLHDHDDFVHDSS